MYLLSLIKTRLMKIHLISGNTYKFAFSHLIFGQNDLDLYLLHFVPAINQYIKTDLAMKKKSYQFRQMIFLNAFSNIYSIIKLVLCILITFQSLKIEAQAYRQITVEKGLSNRRVFSIQKDKVGFMWFLTHEGIDRFDGKYFKHYKLYDNKELLNSLLNLNWLYLDSKGALYEIGKQGKVFRYNKCRDEFEIIYTYKDSSKNNPELISYSFIDQLDKIWLFAKNKLIVFNPYTGKTQIIRYNFGDRVTSVQQISKNEFYLGTNQGLHHTFLLKDQLKEIPNNTLGHLNLEINELYYHKTQQKLYIGTFKKGVLIFDSKSNKIVQANLDLSDITITRIKKLNENELLLGTEGGGIFKMNTQNNNIEPYIKISYNEAQDRLGSSVSDIFIDNEARIWIANYPIGITVRYNKYESYKWHKHSPGNNQSLVNDQVNAIIEDSEGDLWFGTDNGVSLYQSKTQTWKTFLAKPKESELFYNKIILSLCEVSPGIIWAGGYSTGIYEINKKSGCINLKNAITYPHSEKNKYIRDIKKDKEGYIWIGGYYNLKKVDPYKKTIELVKGISAINTICDKNKNELFVGTATGLYLVNKEANKSIRIPILTGPLYIYSLYYSPDKRLYIGTSGLGMIVYNTLKKDCEHYNTNNSALASDNIYSILPTKKDEIILGTEKGLSCYNATNHSISNWTEEQGLIPLHYNAHSATIYSNKYILFGSSDGAVEFRKDINKKLCYSSKIVFTKLYLMNKDVIPGEEYSPLSKPIDETNTLELKHHQNSFSIELASINYECPSNIIYLWKLNDIDKEWSPVSDEKIIRFHNIKPGNYTLCIRAISKGKTGKILEERQLHIKIANSFWLSIGGILLYITLFLIGFYYATRIFILKKQRKVSEEKIQFFINTAHDIRTPLTLIKAPLEEMLEKEALSENSLNNLNTALRNVNTLLHVTTNLINFELISIYSPELYLSEHELKSFINEIYQAFEPYASIRRINFTLKDNFDYLNVWFDKEKMESILKNVISNALKYTPENGTVSMKVLNNGETWSIEVSDTGIGIPINEQRKMFNLHFRGSNAINAKITGSGIGLMLVWKLVGLHKGKIYVESSENKGTSIKMTFEKNNKKLTNAYISERESSSSKIEIELPHNAYEFVQNKQDLQLENTPHILLVEDNDDLRSYLQRTLSDKYNINTCSNGKEALNVIKEFKPELIISDIMMPEMRGDELCHAIKNNIETSHIPVILLTALNDDKNILAGLQIGADEYVVKPFKIGILKAKIANLLTNRLILQNKYINLDFNNENNSDEFEDGSPNMDLQFIASIKRNVEENMDNPTFSIDTVCTSLNMSRTSFYNKLKALTGQAPADYIRLIRLKKATILLKERKYNINEIAELTGFSDAKYFREVFKKHYKVSPSKYCDEENKAE